MAARVAAIPLAAVLLAGCGSEAERADGPPGEPPPPAEPSASMGPDTLQVLMDEYSISMPAVLTTGPTVLRFVNGGFEEHNIYFKRRNAEEASWTLERRMNPGERRVATVELEPGDYTAICDFSGHDGRGMYVDFTVEAPPD